MMVNVVFFWLDACSERVSIPFFTVAQVVGAIAKETIGPELDDELVATLKTRLFFER